MVIDNKTYDLTPTKVHVLMSESIWYRSGDHNLFVLQSYFWYHIQSIVESIRNSIIIFLRPPVFSSLILHKHQPIYSEYTNCVWHLGFIVTGKKDSNLQAHVRREFDVERTFLLNVENKLYMAFALHRRKFASARMPKIWCRTHLSAECGEWVQTFLVLHGVATLGVLRGGVSSLYKYYRGYWHQCSSTLRHPKSKFTAFDPLPLLKMSTERLKYDRILFTV